MYHIILFLHSWVRWLVLIILLIAIYRAYKGWLSGSQFSKFDNEIRHQAASIAHLQLILGVWIYLISPIIHYFLHNFKSAVHDRQMRFFGMEHSSMMLLAIIIITIGSAKAKRKATDKEKFKIMAIWFTISLLIILSSVPWSFSPLTSRPLFRSY